MTGRNQATPTAAAAVQHIPIKAARSGESAAQATSSGASAIQAAAVQDSGGKAAANVSPERPASANGASARAPVTGRDRLLVRSRSWVANRPAAAVDGTRSSRITTKTVRRRAVNNYHRSVSSSVRI